MSSLLWQFLALFLVTASELKLSQGPLNSHFSQARIPVKAEYHPTEGTEFSVKSANRKMLKSNLELHPVAFFPALQFLYHFITCSSLSIMTT